MKFDGVKKKLIVHRKGVTMSFSGPTGLNSREYGDRFMRPDWTGGAMKQSFGSSCHRVGRRMSRTEAKNISAGMAEEAPFAYKDVDEVVNVVDGVGLAKKVVRLKPLAVVIG